jgi:preprotein translocase subunit SecE
VNHEARQRLAMVVIFVAIVAGLLAAAELVYVAAGLWP